MYCLDYFIENVRGRGKKMKITNIIAEKIGLDLKKPIKVAIGCISTVDTVIVKIETDLGISGFGEGSGLTFVTGENSDTILVILQLFKKELIGLNPFSIGYIHGVMDRIIERNTSAKAAIDIALYDIMAKYCKLPLYKFLGGVERIIDTDVTLGIEKPELMAIEAKERIQEGFSKLKIKCGLDLKHDIEAIKCIRDEIGAEPHLKVDANQGYTSNEAIEFMRKTKEFSIEYVEQPTRHDDIESLAHIKEQGLLPVMADESLKIPQDAIELIRRNAADLFNIKLMKCGGIYRAIQINEIGEAVNIKAMIGCMVESSVSISAAAHLMMACPNIVYGDLDSIFVLQDHPRIHRSMETINGTFKLSNSYGHGVEVDFKQ